MKVVHISALDMGGAAIAAIRLHKAMLALGIDSSFLTQGKCNRNIPNKFVFETPQAPISLLSVLKKSVKVKLGLESPHDFHHQQRSLLGKEPLGSGFNFPDTLDDITQSSSYQEADIVHLHWVAGWLDYVSFFAKNTKPVVWTLHDFNPFSGGLHYSIGTAITESQMGKLIDNPQNLLQKAHNRNINTKKQVFENQNIKLQITAPSAWLMRQSEVSLPFSTFTHTHIPNGLDTTIFRPYPQQYVREILGVEDRKTLLFVADDVDSVYKGFHLLVDALKNIANKTDYQYLVIGRDKKNILKSVPNIKHLGYIQDEKLMAMAYNAADAFILPSQMDNFPNTMIESLCCGTPVIAFPTGGIPEAVQHGVNGMICEKSDHQLLADILIDFHAGKYVFSRAEIVSKSAEKYGADGQAKQYINLYNTL